MPFPGKGCPTARRAVNKSGDNAIGRYNLGFYDALAYRMLPRIAGA
jgi:hypothetical protein